MSENASITANGKWMIAAGGHPATSNGYALEILRAEDVVSNGKTPFKINILFDQDGIDLYVTEEDVTPAEIVSQENSLLHMIRGGFFVSWDDLGIEKRSYKDLVYSYSNDGKGLSIGFNNKPDEFMPGLPSLLSIVDNMNTVTVANRYPSEEKDIKMNLSEYSFIKSPELKPARMAL